jgi:hypothetical protein
MPSSTLCQIGQVTVDKKVETAHLFQRLPLNKFLRANQVNKELQGGEGGEETIWIYSVLDIIGGGVIGGSKDLSNFPELLLNKFPKPSSLPLEESPSVSVPGDVERPKWILGNEDWEYDDDLRSWSSRSLKSMLTPPLVGRNRSLESGTDVIPSSVPDSASESSEAAVELGSSDVSTHVVKYRTINR